jgi:hypothetical protein
MAHALPGHGINIYDEISKVLKSKLQANANSFYQNPYHLWMKDSCFSIVGTLIGRALKTEITCILVVPHK